MIEVKSKKIYIKVPAGVIAGGCESQYQLVDAINNIGGNCSIVWDNPNVEDPIPDKYKKYRVYTDEIEDSSDNLIIYPEIWTDQIHTYKNIKKSIWWLSVDYNYGKFQDFSDSNIIHFYQSFYALDFLQKNKVEKYLALFDYIPSKYTDSVYDVRDKKNIVCYNPSKGIEVTNKIKELNPDIEFVPLINMCEDQIIDTLKLSKVYIDFGNHPGRDRIPRESAILGNCIITNTEGSAGYYNDIPIDKKYKNVEVEKIGDVIKKCFADYESIINEYSIYRSSIKNQREQLFNLAKQYFS
jgi:hypothetical protein